MNAIQLIDMEPQTKDIREEVCRLLRQSPKRILSKYFYNERGSQLFEQITKLPDYYLARKELEILHEFSGEMAEILGKKVYFIEYGSGSSEKTAILLNTLRPEKYIPLDISKAHLLKSAQAISSRFPWLFVDPVCVDFMAEMAFPIQIPRSRGVGYFAGSTIANLFPEQAILFMAQVRQLVGEGGHLLVAIDINQDEGTLLRAYDDKEGVISTFNKNALYHLNEILGANFQPEAFRHVAVFNRREGRLEMHLEAQGQQLVQIGQEAFVIEDKERIHTQNSYKYPLATFEDLAWQAGFTLRRVWQDREGFCASLLLSGVKHH